MLVKVASDCIPAFFLFLLHAGLAMVNVGLLRSTPILRPRASRQQMWCTPYVHCPVNWKHLTLPKHG
ncbi:hypothetical protein CYMTET_39970 [Cymbomonas tetramitiformis]|uniref:Uncharacterized protein n=1 Tax=Cymbomonas tetramitiformis TaxID=36881 RepID=A0AAE0CB28_9CHLO|nr:hypothetical protein CYMTET_39970 [Cymbomonas tetramitiformis]